MARKKKEEFNFDEVEELEKMYEENMNVKEKSVIEKQKPKEVADETLETKEEIEKIKRHTSSTLMDDTELRSPIVCVLGHVDTGKTKLLDRIRSTNVQTGEAGGITQQIGATYFPTAALSEIACLKREWRVPGLLIIDTPGHESFSNLRSRGSSLCNIAILVVDAIHALEQQTIESINLLRSRKTPFVVAFNKVDMVYGWKDSVLDITECLNKQTEKTKKDFNKCLNETLLQLAENGLNAKLFTEVTDRRKWISVVPTSAVTGVGIPNLIELLIELSETYMSKALKYEETTECTVLEIKPTERYGLTIDVVLSNGTLSEGDKICAYTLNGPVITTVRSLLTPRPMRELRTKGDFVHHRTVRAALGLKLVASDLEEIVVGTRIVAVTGTDEEAMRSVSSDVESVIERISKNGEGVHLQCSTLGSLEALHLFCEQSKIPVGSASLGPVHKKDVLKASGTTDVDKRYLVMFCFDVRITKDARATAKQQGVTLLEAQIIYHFLDQYKAYTGKIEEDERKAVKNKIVFPCRLSIVPGCVFNTRSPLVIGIDVAEGRLVPGTPIAAYGGTEPVYLGRIVSIQCNKKDVAVVRPGHPSVAIKIESGVNEQDKMFNRHFFETDSLVSVVTEDSIDLLKKHYGAELSKNEIECLEKLKTIFKIGVVDLDL